MLAEIHKVKESSDNRREKKDQNLFAYYIMTIYNNNMLIFVT
ncbi:hypothetical protein PPEP_b0844 [Pseudoalteromonas peptidolytica F12-50-A1]|uniref:Uncharacterized protein n=1 Tax=Pseudoalteromonas peptidolytica F12-50-A1 TaxID=1315280 RepID=A0A8I0N1D9_9GAMM|nr:hypothetical protein [Pseudoalteromonas peptidolytica F12-50-A1]